MRSVFAASSTALQKGSGNRFSSNSSSKPCMRLVAAVLGRSRNSLCFNSRRRVSRDALINTIHLKNTLREGVISSDVASALPVGKAYFASYRKHGCAGLTLRFVYNSINDRWCIVHKPPGWSLHAHPSRPSVASVLQPLLDASIASRGCNHIGGGLKESSCGLIPGAGQRSYYEQPQRDSQGRPVLPQGMLREMELETAAQDEIRGLYFPFQLDADAQGLVLVATDAQMNALLCHLLNEDVRIRCEYRVLSDISRLLACRRSPGGAGSPTQRSVLTSTWSNAERNSNGNCSSSDTATTRIDKGGQRVNSSRAGIERQQAIKEKKKAYSSTLTALPYFASTTHWGWSPMQRLRLNDATTLQTPGHSAPPREHGVVGSGGRVRRVRSHWRGAPVIDVREGNRSCLQKGQSSSSGGFAGILKPIAVEKQTHDGNNSVKKNSVGGDDDTGEKHEDDKGQTCTRRSTNAVPQRSAFKAAGTSGEPARTDTEADSQTTKDAITSYHPQPAFAGGREAYDLREKRRGVLLTPEEWTEETGDEIGRADCFITPIHKCLQLYDFHREELLLAGKLVSSVSQRHCALRSLSALTDPVAPPSTHSQPPPHLYCLNNKGCSERIDASEESSSTTGHAFQPAEASCLSEGRRKSSNKQLQALSRRALLQLLDGSFLTPPLARYFCRNVLGHSICRESAPTTHPLSLHSSIQQETACSAREHAPGLAAGQQKAGTASFCGAESGIRGSGSCRQDRKVLACTTFFLMSTHCRRLNHGDVRTLGLYRVSLQAGAQRTHQIRVHFSEAGAPLANDALYNPTCNASLSQRVVIPYAFDSLAEDESLRKANSFSDDIGDVLLLGDLSTGIQCDSDPSAHPGPSNRDVNTDLRVCEDNNIQTCPPIFQSASDNVNDTGSRTGVTQGSRQSELELGCDPVERFSILSEYSSLEKHLTTTTGGSVCPHNGSSGSDNARNGIAWNNDSCRVPFTINSPEISGEAGEKCNKRIGRTSRCASYAVSGVTVGSRTDPSETESLAPASTAAMLECSAMIPGSSLEDESSTGTSVYPLIVPNTERVIKGEDYFSAGFSRRSKTERDDAQVTGASLCSESPSLVAASKQGITQSAVIVGEENIEGGRTLCQAESEGKQEERWSDRSERVCSSLGLQLFRLVMPDPLHLGGSTQLVIEIGPPPEWGGVSD